MSVRRRSVIPLWILWLISVCGPAVQAVELEQLWFPESYLRHLPRLYDGAKLVAESERCAQFINGSVQVDRSSLTHPVFRYNCRDQGLRTYSLLVDGLTLEVLDPTRPGGRVSFAELEREWEAELERQRQLEEARAAVQQEIDEELALRRQQALEQARLEQEELERQLERQRRQGLWELCNAALRQRIGQMADVHWLTHEMPDDPHIDGEGVLVYEVDFDAKDWHGEALRYRGFCRMKSSDEYRVTIRPRRLVAPD